MLARGTARYRRLFAVVLSALAMSGCGAIHPLPDDVAHISTYNIVRQIRCETRKAVIDSLRTFLTEENNRFPIKQNGRVFQKVDDRSYAIGQQTFNDYDADPASIAKFNPAALTGFARYVVDVMLHTGVAYNFDLTGYEQNNIDPEINFIRPLPISTQVSLGVKGNFDRYRQNERSFTITDNFLGLIKNVPESYCTKYIAEANIIYPIFGNVGVRKMVHDFMLLTLFGNLTGDGTKDFITIGGPPTMVDQLEFQTTIGGSATPKVVFAPVGPAFQLSDANLGVSASRRDTHKLTMGLYLDTAGATEAKNLRNALFDGLIVGNLITASGGKAELGAAKAVEQFLQQKIFRPTIVFQQ